MNRRPRTEAEQFAWHRATLEHIALHGEKDRNRPPIHESEPNCGWYRRRLIPKGPWVPVRIWIEPGETDPETGDMVSPEKMRCEVDGKLVDVHRAWTWVAQNPISEDEYMDLKAGSFRNLAPVQENPAPQYVAKESTSHVIAGPSRELVGEEVSERPATGDTCF